MPVYTRLKYIKNRQEVIEDLQALREQIHSEMPRKSASDSLILGTWNIRNFDDNRFGYGYRMEESLYYIAEIINAFDVIAVQEVCRSLSPLRKVMRILGTGWNFILTDITEGRSGNEERLGFIYNENKVDFRGIAGELVLPHDMLISSVDKQLQFSRTPFSASFQAGWFRFVFATVHIYFGKEDKKSPEFKRRVSEIGEVARFLSKRAVKEPDNYVLVGDFNIVDLEGETFDALESNGFTVFKNKTGSNVKQTRFYDQISFKARRNQVRLAPSDKNHGVLNFFDSVMKEGERHALRYLPEWMDQLERKLEYSEGKLSRARSAKSKAKHKKDIAEYQAAIAGLRPLLVPVGKSWKPREWAELKDDPANPLESEAFKRWVKDYGSKWRTFQLSDHFPLWVELQIDFTDDYLNSIKRLRKSKLEAQD